MAEGGQLPQEKPDILKRLADSLECSICMEQYTDPRVLNCQHSFCAKCLNQHVGESDIIRCPLCNSESVKPAEGIDGLKSNFFIKSLIEDVIGKKSELQEELKPNPKCGNCDEGNDAVSHCEDCGCDLCLHCEDMHKKMKALKDHKVTPLPTEGEISEEVKVKSEAMIERITHYIHDREAHLNTKILSLRNTIRGIEQKRDAEINKMRNSHRQLLVQIDEYVQQLSTKINSSAAERLGDMPQELTDYEQQLKTYKTLKQQGWMINNIQIHKRIERCQELMQQVNDFQQRTKAAVYRGGSNRVVAPKFVDGGADQSQLKSNFFRCLGYLKPILSRFDRKVEIRKEYYISENKKHGAIELMHDALDHFADYPTTPESLAAMRDWMNNQWKRKYPWQKWSVIVGYEGCYESIIWSDRILRVVIDNMLFSLIKT